MYYVVYSSITFATGMKNKFRYDSEKINILHTPSEISTAGCSYCLEVETHKKAMEIINASEEYGVSVKALYRKEADNTYVKLDF